MVFEVVRGYVQLASGLGELTRARATEVAQGLLSLPAAGVATGGQVAVQVAALAEELLATAAANRQNLAALVRSEVDVAVTRLGLVSADKLEESQAEAARLRAEVARLRSDSAGKRTVARTSAPRKSAASKIAAKKSTARKSTAKTSPAKKSTAKTTPAKKSTAKTSPAKKNTAKASPAKGTSATRAAARPTAVGKADTRPAAPRNATKTATKTAAKTAAKTAKPAPRATTTGRSAVTTRTPDGT